MITLIKNGLIIEVTDIHTVNLKKRQTNTIDFVVPAIDHPYFSALLEHVVTYKSRSCIQLMICQTSGNIEKEKEFIQLLQQKRPDGLLFTELIYEPEDIRQEMEQLPIIVCSNLPFSDLSRFSVYMDHYESAVEGFHFLHEEIGCSKLAVCLHGQTGIVRNGRLAAYKDYIMANGLGFKEERVIKLTSGTGMFDGIELHEKLDKIDEQPKTVFTGSDQTATGYLLYRNSSSTLVVLGFDHQPISMFLSFPTVEQPIEMLAERSTSRLIDRIEERADWTQSAATPV
ncbi:hypothetical protein [Jeotgalibacillus soli]|uniref:Periplasmic binding protein/LacI sugar binding domain-containing protein n=1 Tax=Jeotgalibacillus soli TaxID=889306 RepID=A0A0C2VF85_9BACL|nr:hypothetical protein [Jeotgalibacillus soli]KIL42673.1 hypothetical protein KP78_38960 [Jeotgalibacillus soli]